VFLPSSVLVADVLTDFEVACANGSVYVGYIGVGGVKVARSVDGGVTWTTVDVTGGALNASDLRLCASGPYVYVAWVDDSNGDVCTVNASTDGGATWRPTAATLGGQVRGLRAPHVACDGPDCYVAWEDDTAPTVHVMLNRSLDGGQTWLPAPLPTESEAGGAFGPLLATGNGHVHLVYSPGGSAVAKVMYTRSSDDGSSWDPAAQLSVDAPPLEQQNPFVLAADGSSVFLVWNHTPAGAGGPPFNDVYGVSSSTSGAGWSGPFPLDRDGPRTGSAGLGSANSLALDGSSALAALGEGTQTVTPPFVFHADLFAATWSAGGGAVPGGPPWIHSNPTGVSDHPHAVACKEGDLAVALFSDDRNDPTPDFTGDYEAFLAVSTDGGLTWLPDERISDAGEVVPYPFRLATCCDATHVYAFWTQASGIRCQAGTRN
jgi:hypothetical protein